MFQIFELEKRFLYQKYLSPADRDEIAAQLGLSNAQVEYIHIYQKHLSPADPDEIAAQLGLSNAQVQYIHIYEYQKYLYYS